MLAEDVVVLDADSHLWRTLRPVLDGALRIEQSEDTHVWHGWNKRQIQDFLRSLPTHCSLVLAVWDTVIEETGEARDVLVLGGVGEVVHGEVQTIRTLEALQEADLPPIEQLEPGYKDALAIMRAARMCVAPVAWALFTDKATWDAWFLGEDDSEDTSNNSSSRNENNREVINKGDVLTSFVRQGRCVLMGSQTAHQHV